MFVGQPTIWADPSDWADPPDQVQRASAAS
jgi:hypothetical protein